MIVRLPLSVLLGAFSASASPQGPATRPEHTERRADAITLRGADGSAVLLERRTRLVLTLSAPALAGTRLRVLVGTPPDARITPDDELVSVPPDARSVTLERVLEVEESRAAQPLRCSVEVRDAAGDALLLREEETLSTAIGADFVRTDFETGERRPGRRSQQQPAASSPSGRGLAVSASTPGFCGARALHLRCEEAEGSYGLLSVERPADAPPLARFGFLTLAVRGEIAKAALRLRSGTHVVEVPLADLRAQPASRPTPAPEGWRRLSLALAPLLRDRGAAAGAHLEDVELVLRGEGTSLTIDEFAISTRGELTAGDRLRDLCQRHAAGLQREDGAAFRVEFAALDPESLSPAERVDHVLLENALALERALAGLPRKVAGQPTGEARFAALVRHQQMLAETPEQLVAIGWEAIREHQRLLSELAPRIAPGKSWREALEVLRSRHPSAAELPKLAERNWIEARDFTLAKELVTVPLAARHGIVDPVTDGPLARTYAFGGYGGARPSPHGYTGTFLVSPPGAWMTPEQAEERLRGNYEAWCRVVALHEMVPGHHLQTVVHEMRPLSPFRRSFYATLFAEGWALYCEQVFADAGYCDDPAVRFAWLQMRLWRAARVVMDASLQTGRMTKQEAVDLFVAQAGLLRENAEAEIARDVDAPTRPLSYYMGYRKIAELEAEVRAREGAAFAPRAFRDRLLSFGPIPLAAIRKGFGL